MAQIIKQTTATGQARFVVDYRCAGRRYRKFFKSFEDADAYLSTMKIKIYGNQFQARPKPVSLAQVLWAYLRDSSLRKSKRTHRDTDLYRLGRFLVFLYSRRTAAQSPDQILPAMRQIEKHGGEQFDPTPETAPLLQFLRMTRLETISRLELEEYQRALKEEGRPGTTVNSYLATVSTLLSFCVTKNHLTANPALGIKKLPEDKKLVHPYTKAEIVGFLRAARTDDERRNYRFRASGRTFQTFGIVATALFAGLREGELAFLEWQDVDFERDVIWIKSKPEYGFKPKWYHERTVPIEPLLRQILEPMKKEKGWCFPAGNGGTAENNMLRDVKRAGTAAGLKKVNVHFLRHNYASHQIMMGVSHFQVMRAMGHKDAETLLRYVHISPGTNRFKNPSIFAEQDIFALLDAPPAQESKVIPMEAPKEVDDQKLGG